MRYFGAALHTLEVENAVDVVMLNDRLLGHTIDIKFLMYNSTDRRLNTVFSFIAESEISETQSISAATTDE